MRLNPPLATLKTGLAIILLCAFSCKGVKKAKKIANHIEKDSYELKISEEPTKEITLDYIGCSGFLIRRGNHAVLTDPYFSNHGPLLKVPFKNVQTNLSEVENFFKERFEKGKDLKGIIKFLTVTHSHYDHLGDVPYIFRNYLSQETEILGSHSTVNVMDHLLSPKEIRERKITCAEGFASTNTKVGRSYTDETSSIRITPIRSAHAPHFYGIHLFQGNVEREKNFNNCKSSQWKEGTNLSYLIDFLDENQKSEFRIYIAGSASPKLKGCPPKKLLEEKKIDLAILCMASYKFTRKYPKAKFECLLEKDQPTEVIFSHWENFFQPLEKLRETPMVVPFTNAKRFIKKTNKYPVFRDAVSHWTIPQPGVQITVKY